MGKQKQPSPGLLAGQSSNYIGLSYSQGRWIFPKHLAECRLISYLLEIYDEFIHL